MKWWVFSTYDILEFERWLEILRALKLEHHSHVYDIGGCRRLSVEFYVEEYRLPFTFAKIYKDEVPY